MRNRDHAAPVVVALLAFLAIGCGVFSSAGGSSWQKEFGISERSLVSTGRNEYFILEPGFQLVLEKKNEKLVITVLEETREVDGVVTRVVEEREWKRGAITEVSRNFFGICEETNDVFYFGEDVDMYKRGKISSHHGEWLAGEKNARPGLMMPGQPVLGLKHYQELAPGVAMDRAEVVSLDDTLRTPAGVFTGCLKTKEGTSLNWFAREHKIYAPGIGLIQDQKLLLTRYGFLGEE